MELLAEKCTVSLQYSTLVSRKDHPFLHLYHLTTFILQKCMNVIASMNGCKAETINQVVYWQKICNIWWLFW